MVYNKINKIELEGTLFQFCNLGRKFNPNKNIRNILFKNLKKRIKKDEIKLLSKILRYKTNFETDIFDENLEREFQTLLKKRANQIHDEMILKRKAVKFFQIPQKKRANQLHKGKILRKKVLEFFEALLKRLYSKKILKKRNCLNGMKQPFDRFFINPKFLKDLQIRLDNFLN